MALARLQARASLLGNIRRFLDEQGVCEVQTPLLTTFPTVESHIEPFCVSATGPYLITSPEYSMKRLLAEGSGSIYQISSVFRQEEQGTKHRPEFSMLEFYLVGEDHMGLMDFVERLLITVLGWPQVERVDYVDLFKKRLGIDPLGFSHQEFLDCAWAQNLDVPDYLCSLECDPADQLDYLFGLCLEPNLGQSRPVFLCGYPAFMASLSRLDQDDRKRSTRFELFYQQMELGNGFYELNDSAEQRRRFEQINRSRVALGKGAWLLDEPFLAAVDQLPDCAGIAIGIDRLLMIQSGVHNINQILALPERPVK